jgi:hypothetical protein
VRKSTSWVLVTCTCSCRNLGLTGREAKEKKDGGVEEVGHLQKLLRMTGALIFITELEVLLLR